MELDVIAGDSWTAPAWLGGHGDLLQAWRRRVLSDESGELIRGRWRRAAGVLLPQPVDFRLGEVAAAEDANRRWRDVETVLRQRGGNLLVAHELRTHEKERVAVGRQQGARVRGRVVVPGVGQEAGAQFVVGHVASSVPIFCEYASKSVPLARGVVTRRWWRGGGGGPVFDLTVLGVACSQVYHEREK